MFVELSIIEANRKILGLKLSTRIWHLNRVSECDMKKIKKIICFKTWNMKQYILYNYNQTQNNKWYKTYPDIV